MLAAQPSSRDTAGDELRRMIAELARPHRHREHYVRDRVAGGPAWASDHVTDVPPLLVQLRFADAPQGSSRSGAGYESRPAAPLESLDTLTRIDLEVSRWVRDLGEDDPTSTIDCVSLLGGLLPSATRCDRPRAHRDRDTGRVDCCTWHAVELDVRRWWTQARIVTGWDSPPWRPDNTCPQCGVRRSLRIRLAERIGFCAECHETWGPQEYQVLAEHVRLESEEQRQAVQVGPCWCPWPPSVAQVEWRGQLFGLCPRCGSTSCRHAVKLTRRRSS